MSKHFYPAIFTKEQNGYSVRFPDLQGCFTEGDTLEEAYTMAVEAIGLYLADSAEEVFNFPTASDITQIKPCSGEAVVLIEFDELEYIKRHSNKAVKKTLTIPQWLNVIAEENNINFSQLLQQAIKEQLNLA